MTKIVLTTRLSSTYDDDRESRYQLPRTYLRQIESAVADWCVYYEPRRTTADGVGGGGMQSYFATARIVDLRADPAREDHYYAKLADYLEFDRRVPFREGETTYEHQLTKADGSTNRGAFGRAVRPISEHEFDTIVTAGFGRTLFEQASHDAPAGSGLGAGLFAEPGAEFRRPIIERIVARPFRDAAFAEAVKTAYRDTCAMTGLHIVNGGGRPEVQAAHIRPVARDGPDAIRNGLALSGTMHWMFDRGLISIGDELNLMVSSAGVPEEIGRMLNPSGRLRMPERPELRPHPSFLKFHRDNVFKG